MKFKKWWVVISFLFILISSCFCNKNEYNLSKEQINEIISIILKDVDLPSKFIEEIVQKGK